MRTLTFYRYTLCVGAAIAVLAGCNSQIQTNAPVAMGAPAARKAALTMVRYAQGPVHPDRGPSRMSLDKTKEPLLYVGDWDTNDVYVYGFPNGNQVGTLTGFSEPYGMCVDAKSDVYIANFGAGTLVEYAYDGSTPLNTYNSGGEPIGCSVSTKGDVAVTSFDPGEVTVYAKGNPQNGKTYSDSNCEYMWTMGYDNKGNLIGGGEYNSIGVCALLAGAKKMTVLSTKGITVDFPGGTSWDGKYIALGDQEAGGTYQTGVWPSTLSGKTLIAATKEVAFTDDCYQDYTDDVNPFFLGKNFKQITPASRQRAKYMVGPNLWCADAGSSETDVWHYPSGKLDKHFSSGSSPPGAPYGAAVSVPPIREKLK